MPIWAPNLWNQCFGKSTEDKHFLWCLCMFGMFLLFTLQLRNAPGLQLTFPDSGWDVNSEHSETMLPCLVNVWIWESNLRGLTQNFGSIIFPHIFQGHCLQVSQRELCFPSFFGCWHTALSPMFPFHCQMLHWSTCISQTPGCLGFLWWRASTRPCWSKVSERFWQMQLRWLKLHSMSRLFTPVELGLRNSNTLLHSQETAQTPTPQSRPWLLVSDWASWMPAQSRLAWLNFGPSCVRMSLGAFLALGLWPGWANQSWVFGRVSQPWLPPKAKAVSRGMALSEWVAAGFFQWMTLWWIPRLKRLTNGETTCRGKWGLGGKPWRQQFQHAHGLGDSYIRTYLYIKDVGILPRVVATVAAGGIVRLGPTASLTTAPYRVSSKSTRRWSYVGNHLVQKSGMRWIHYLPSMSMHGSFRRYGLRRSSTANTNMSLKWLQASIFSAPLHTFSIQTRRCSGQERSGWVRPAISFKRVWFGNISKFATAAASSISFACEPLRARWRARRNPGWTSPLSFSTTTFHQNPLGQAQVGRGFRFNGASRCLPQSPCQRHGLLRKSTFLAWWSFRNISWRSTSYQMVRDTTIHSEVAVSMPPLILQVRGAGGGSYQRTVFGHSQVVAGMKWLLKICERGDSVTTNPSGQGQVVFWRRLQLVLHPTVLRLLLCHQQVVQTPSGEFVSFLLMVFTSIQKCVLSNFQFGKMPKAARRWKARKAVKVYRWLQLLASLRCGLRWPGFDRPVSCTAWSWDNLRKSGWEPIFAYFCILHVHIKDVWMMKYQQMTDHGISCRHLAGLMQQTYQSVSIVQVHCEGVFYFLLPGDSFGCIGHQTPLAKDFGPEYQLYYFLWQSLVRKFSGYQLQLKPSESMKFAVCFFHSFILSFLELPTPPKK